MNFNASHLWLRVLLGPFLPRAFAPTASDPDGREADVATSIYRSLMERMSEGAVILTPTGDLLDSNSRAAPMLGLDPAILEGLPFPTALEEAGAPAPQEAFDAIQTASADDHPLTFGPYMLGPKVALDLYSFRVGVQVLILGILRAKPGQAAPHAVPAVPVSAPPPPSAPAGPGGDLRLDASGTVVEADPEALDLLGKSESQIVGKPFADLVTALNPAGMADRMRRQTETTGSWTGVLKVQKKSELLEMSLRTQALPGGEGLTVSVHDRSVAAGPASPQGIALPELVQGFATIWGQFGDTTPSPSEILRCAGGPLDYDLACFEEFHEQRGEFEIIGLDDRTGSRVKEGLLLPGTTSSSGKVCETGEALTFDDISEERRWEDLALFQDFGSGMKLPLRSGNRFLGVLSVWSLQKNFFQGAHRTAASVLGALLELAAQGSELTRLRDEAAEHERLAREKGAVIDRISEAVLALDTEGNIQWANRAALRLTERSKEILTSGLVTNLFSTEDAQAIRERLGRGEWSEKLSLALPGGQHRRVAASLTGTAGDVHRGMPIFLILRDCEAEEGSSEMAAQLARQLETAERVLDLNPDAIDLADYLKRFTAAIHHTMPFEEAQLFVPSSEGEAIVLQAAANRSRARLERDVYYPMEETILGSVSQAGEARVVDKLTNENSVDAIGLMDSGFRSAAILPLPPPKEEGSTAPGQGPWPLLVLLTAEQEAFSPEDLPALGPLCGPLVRALERFGPSPGAAVGELGT